jgi:hypothetical protein
MLAHDCTLLEIGINFDRLYSGVDPDYELCLRSLRNRVNETHRQNQPAER